MVHQNVAYGKVDAVGDYIGQISLFIEILKICDTPHYRPYAYDGCEKEPILIF